MFKPTSSRLHACMYWVAAMWLATSVNKQLHVLPNQAAGVKHTWLPENYIRRFDGPIDGLKNKNKQKKQKSFPRDLSTEARLRWAATELS